MFYGGRVIGVVHLGPLPRSPGYGDIEAVVERAVADARAYAAGGAHAFIVENYGDAPFFPGRLPPETVAAITRCAAAVRGAIERSPRRRAIARAPTRSSCRARQPATPRIWTI